MRTLVAIGAVNGFLAVALGAFGAHGLKARLSPAMLDLYKTGVQYHLAHALAILLLAALSERIPAMLPGWLFLSGIVLFSGSLYLLAVTRIGTLGVITPFGGLCFLAGWAALAIGALQSSQS